jgi:hypothetical protein
VLLTLLDTTGFLEKKSCKSMSARAGDLVVVETRNLWQVRVRCAWSCSFPPIHANPPHNFLPSSPTTSVLAVTPSRSSWRANHPSGFHSAIRAATARPRLVPGAVATLQLLHPHVSQLPQGAKYPHDFKRQRNCWAEMTIYPRVRFPKVWSATCEWTTQSTRSSWLST